MNRMLDWSQGSDEHLIENWVMHLEDMRDLESRSPIWEAAVSSATECERELKRRGYSKQEREDILQEFLGQ